MIYYGYNKYMGDDIELEWDEAKRQQTLKERDIDFKLARYIAYGMVHSRVFKLCYTMRGAIYRIISLHKIHESKQEQYYGKNSQDDRQGN